MLFSSFSFLFAFLPPLLLIYFLLKERDQRNLVLLVFSLIFYAWGEPLYVFLMIGMIVLNWLIGFQLVKEKKTLWLILGILLDLGVLGVYKYADFAVRNINGILHTSLEAPQLALPIGISFYTFQILSYLFDIYRGKVQPQKKLLRFACYVSLFPQLIAGPIVRYADVERELTERKENWEDASKGFRRFFYGLGKKVILANSAAVIANKIFTLPLEELTFATAWSGALAYTLQIYFDFGGYSDMAIGLGRIFGFHFLENFNDPYQADSITDFWRRWHISLSSWFRDYVYIPLGGSRKGLLRQIFNLFVVWALTGLWHGAAWTFVLWGLWFFFLLVLEKLFLLKVLKKLPVLNRVYTLLCVIIGWVIFNSAGRYQIVAFLKAMFSRPSWPAGLFLKMGFLSLAPALLAGVFFCTPLPKKISKALGESERAEVLRDIGSLLVFFLCVLYLVNNSYNPFIYFHF